MPAARRKFRYRPAAAGFRPKDIPADRIGISEACIILQRDKKTVIRWARDQVTPLHIVEQRPGKNGAMLLDRAEVMRLARRLRRQEEEAS